MFWTSKTMETSKVLHFRNCKSNCSNSSRVLELSGTLLNPCSQKIELNNPGSGSLSLTTKRLVT